MSYGDEQPIAALATVPGESALALIRTSGKNALELLSRAFSRARALREAAGNTVVHGWIVDPDTGEKIDETLAAVYRASRSYTGEEGADISCHGGTCAARAVLGALRRVGFRDALPGEFTFRAFINGKLDLTKAEAVMELVSAKTDGARARAVSRLAGSLEAELREIQSLLVRVLAGAELLLDYAEDEIDSETGGEEAEYLPNRRLAEEALCRLRGLSQSYERERLYRDGVLVVIAGKPNAGKSSLFNLLLREDRAIVADTPGTTRDWIEGWISLAGVPVRLADTAGLRDSQDTVEEAGVERTRELLGQADATLYLIDGAAGISPEDSAFLSDKSDKSTVLGVWNKIDRAPLPARSGLIGISAKTGAGVEELVAALITRITAASRRVDGEPAGIATARQKECIDAAIESAAEGLFLADTRAPLDLAAPRFREAVRSIGEITGDVSTAEILEVMFSTFCVGK
jgi:tRNA modification GTPase